MTVSSNPPIERYTGNGVITQFDWDWDMIDDSAIGVMVDNQYSDDWELEGNSVVFGTAPADGVDVIVYRRTKLWMPEDYVAFGRFYPDKTELSMDRAIMIAQERHGDAKANEPPNGIVGAANIYASPAEFHIDLISERGQDAVIPMWNPDDSAEPVTPDPDPAIIWGGDDIEASYISDNAPLCVISFRMSLSLGDPAEASAKYTEQNIAVYTGWLDHDPSDNEYWMRVTETGTPNANTRIYTGDHFEAFGVAFPMVGTAPYVYTQESGNGTQVATVTIEICADDGGLPDGAWVSRNVRLEAIYHA